MGQQNNQQNRKIPMRMCSGCGEMKPKKELARVVKNKDGNVSLDLTGKLAGRGAYVCKNAGCLKKAIKARRIERSLQTKIPDEIYDMLEAQLKENE